MASEMMSNKRTTNERRGVAPIIATLLMVAIAVVGGILIFVFAQGFFNTTSVQGPTVESITLFGYDAREIAAVENFAGVAITNAGFETPANNQISEDEEIALYFRNTGSQDLVLASLEVAGRSSSFNATDILANIPDAGSYVIMQDAVDPAVVETTSIIPAGEDVTIIVSIEGEAPLKVGRNYPVEITTGNGATFKFDIVAGTTRGGA